MPDVKTVARFVFASGFAAVISSAMMAFTGQLIDLSIPLWHIVTATVAYFTAVRVNYVLQRRWVFRRGDENVGVRPFFEFLFVNGANALLVAFLSASLMSWGWLSNLTGRAHAVASLLIAAMILAPISFVLTRKVIEQRQTEDLQRRGTL